MKTLISLCIIILLSTANTARSEYCSNGEYRDYESTIDQKAVINRLNKKASESEGYATIVSIGTTTENREIKGILITNPSSAAQKVNVLFTGAIHANEWIGTEVAVGLAEYLVTNKTNTASVFGPKNMNIKKLLDYVQIIIVPVLNPDGYVYSRATDTTWRKNRRDLSSIEPGAYGVDINRNFATFYQPSDDSEVNDSTYAGKEPMSEKENQAVKEAFDMYRFKAEIDFHSGNTYVLYPWGVGSTSQELRPHSNTRDEDLLKQMSIKIAEYNAIPSTNVGATYNSAGDHFVGLARDWEYATYKSASFNIELHEKYQPPVGEIKGICEKNIKGPVWLMFWAADQGFRSKPKLYIGN